MPKSRSRQKQRRSGASAYQLAPQQRKKTRSSPRWYGPVILGVMALGVIVIVLNYMGLVPGDTSPLYLWLGLGLIGVGFIGTMYWT